MAPRRLEAGGRRAVVARRPEWGPLTWAALFERAPDCDRDRIAAAIATARDRRDDASGDDDDDDRRTTPDDPGDARVARLTADVDVLVADLCGDAAARTALDHWRRHSWMRLVVTERLLDEAHTVAAAVADEAVAADWRTLLTARATVVQPAAGGHAALVAAYSGGAAHLLSDDPELTGARAGAGLRAKAEISVKRPDAFARLFDPAAIYETAVGGTYPGPDRDPRD